ncbi:hypothetical protein CPB83DRAFT_830508 [Crepidotus variabilis]|uniref:SET domain-containing protein n=1 Tax=Crepidotus variabilis TaxID=179855 RepID=A0A9P6JWS4_9AGAR|nr:hypothetical protein CPB83DRAFT_830508 [Crepidotus variabilis]
MPKKQVSSERKQVQSHHPSNWPSVVRFIQSPAYHVSVPAAVRSHIEGSCISLKNNQIPISKDAKVVIRRITDTSHPAFGQFGLFAGQRIPPKMHIIYYFGEIHCDDRSDSNYDLSLCRLDGEINVGIDAHGMGNQARFVNDYRGIADKPNSIFVDGRLNSGALSMTIWSGNQEIKKGQEILVSYGKSWWQSRRSGPADGES